MPKTCASIFLMYVNSVTFCKLGSMKIAFYKVYLRVICKFLGYEIANCKLVCVQNQKVLLAQKIR